ncbi:MAG: envelope fusion protein, partial [Candidatus Thiodiazotropha sp.]
MPTFSKFVSKEFFFSPFTSGGPYSRMMLTLLTASLILGLYQKTCAIDDELQRINYGVIFQHKAGLELTTDYWLHTFEIQLPEPLTTSHLSGCHNDKNICHLFKPILKEIHDIVNRNEMMLNNTVKTIENLVRNSPTDKPNRRRRSIFSFVGELSKTIFGTATVEDVNTLAKHINALHKQTRNIVNLIQQHEDGVSSFMTTANARMTNLMTGINENHEAISHLHSTMKNTFKHLEKAFSSMDVLVAEQLQHSQQLQYTLEELISGVYDLTQGKLSPALIPSHILSKCLDHITSILHDKFQGLYLSKTLSHDPYNSLKFAYARKHSKLYITVKFPVCPFPEPINLFQVQTFPVPVNHSTAHATQLLDLTHYFAITQDLQYYAMLQNWELESCFGSRIMLCHQTKALIPSTHQTCASALFTNDKASVKTLCNFRFLTDHIKPDLIEVTKNSVIVYNNLLLELDCATNKKMIKGCNFCLITKPCHCSISSQENYLPPRLSSCQHKTDNVTILHPVNLALLQQFFNESSLESILADTVYPEMLDVDVPFFRLYNHSMSSVLADDNKRHLSLQKMATKAKNDAVIFKSLSESLLDDDLSVSDAWPTTTDIMLFATMAATALSILALLYTYIKLRKVLLILTTLQQSTNVKAATLPSFHYHETISSTP